MEKKTIIIIGLVILLLATIIIIKAATTYRQVTPVYFKSEPGTWIQDNRNSQNPADRTIDVNRATKTLSVFDGKKQEYYYYGKRITFFSHGYYKGLPFTEAYVSPFVTNQTAALPLSEQIKLAEKNTLIRISPNMNPSDGIMDSFILAKVEDKEFVFYIFVDEDWKKQMKETNILWGDDLKDKNNVKIRKYDFGNGDEGIYVDKITGVSWYRAGTVGGIFVGEINKDMLNLKSEKDLNATFIYVQ